ncbi:hypothetical protein IFO70_31585 [Phormidium tenue FACHB-886]|nr:hypothetical protein [Phormidium tenue FACHB-886]
MWIQLGVILLFLGLATFFILRWGLTIVTVDGDSMAPTLTSGDRLLIFNLYPNLWLSKGQIVVGRFSEMPLDAVLFADTPDLADPSFPSDFAIDAIDLLPTEPDPVFLADLEEIEMACDGSTSSKFIKRITGLPGDTVSIPLSTLPETLQPMLCNRSDQNGNLVWHIPAHHCFVRGDSPFSVDSLLLGTIPLSAITGIAVRKLTHQATLEASLQHDI